MTTYAKLLRAAATLKRVQAGLDSLAARARDDDERDRLQRAAAQARVMSEGLERRIRHVLAEEPQYAREAPAAPDRSAPQERDQGERESRGTPAPPAVREPGAAGRRPADDVPAGKEPAYNGSGGSRSGKRNGTAHQATAVKKGNARLR